MTGGPDVAPAAGAIARIRHDVETTGVAALAMACAAQ
jgi:hypothetical protein